MCILPQVYWKSPERANPFSIFLSSLIYTNGSKEGSTSWGHPPCKYFTTRLRTGWLWRVHKILMETSFFNRDCSFLFSGENRLNQSALLFYFPDLCYTVIISWHCHPLLNSWSSCYWDILIFHQNSQQGFVISYDCKPTTINLLMNFFHSVHYCQILLFDL